MHALQMLESEHGPQLDKCMFLAPLSLLHVVHTFSYSRATHKGRAGRLALPGGRSLLSPIDIHIPAHHPIPFNSPGRVLLIHAGGYSKRLPHVSVVGKIFTALPLGTVARPRLLPPSAATVSPASSLVHHDAPCMLRQSSLPNARGEAFNVHHLCGAYGARGKRPAKPRFFLSCQTYSSLAVNQPRTALRPTSFRRCRSLSHARTILSFLKTATSSRLTNLA